MKILTRSLILLFNPRRGWQAIAEHPVSVWQVYLFHTIPLAAIPALAWYYGTTRQGWTFAGETIFLTPDSAMPICALFYIAILVGVAFLGYMVNWMAETYEAGSNFAASVTLIAYTATPFFIAGLLGLFPSLWFDILVGIGVGCYCIYLLYTGTSKVMGVAPERGFLYASAVFAVALVSFVALLGASVILWDIGPQPEYTPSPQG